MRFGALGPLLAHNDYGTPLILTRRSQHATLPVLLMNPQRPPTRAFLIDAKGVPFCGTDIVRCLSEFGWTRGGGWSAGTGITVNESNIPVGRPKVSPVMAAARGQTWSPLQCRFAPIAKGVSYQWESYTP